METSTAEAAPLEILETEEEILVELGAVVLEADEDDKAEEVEEGRAVVVL